MERPEYSRRDFLKLFGLTTLGAVTQGLTACTSPQVENSSVLPQKTKTLPELRAENQATIELIKEKPPITQEVFDEICQVPDFLDSHPLSFFSWCHFEN